MMTEAILTCMCVSPQLNQCFVGGGGGVFQGPGTPVRAGEMSAREVRDSRAPEYIPRLYHTSPSQAPQLFGEEQSLF